MRYGVWIRKAGFGVQYLLGIAVGHFLISTLLSKDQHAAEPRSFGI
jgi:hypothetical protein